MKQSDTLLELTLTDVAFGGDAIGRREDGKAVFVPFAMAGERVRVRIEADQPRLARGALLDVIEANPRRCAAPCPYYTTCGGCVYQHMEYAAELDCKQRQLVELLRRLGGLDSLPEMEPAYASPAAYGYRNKLRVEPVKVAVGPGDERVGYGYCMRDNVTFFELSSCPLAGGPLNELLPRVPATREGRHNATRLRPSPLTLRLTHDGGTSFFFGRAPRRVPWLRERLLERPVSVPLGSFWQVNAAVAEALARRVAEWFAAEPTRTLVDAYCGVGTFSLAIGKSAHTRFLIESDELALQAAEFNHAQWDGLECRCRRGTTEAVLPRLLADANLKRTTVLLDPPRQGCGDSVLKALCDFPVGQVLYVSCNAATLARDLKRLVQVGGYRVHRLALFDMFPRTAHFETAVCLNRG
jgi:tRNA/tmRNA/rRNA uracil-C5-methylase (TrmA/RlmC/RlmD family)